MRTREKLWDQDSLSFQLDHPLDSTQSNHPYCRDEKSEAPNGKIAESNVAVSYRAKTGTQLPAVHIEYPIVPKENEKGKTMPDYFIKL